MAEKDQPIGEITLAEPGYKFRTTDKIVIVLTDDSGALTGASVLADLGAVQQILAPTPTDPPPMTGTAPKLVLELSTPTTTVGKTVVLTAKVTPGTAKVTKVEFFDGGNRIGEPLTVSPFAFDYVAQITGKHALVAKVTDAAGNAVVSDVQYVTVNAVGAAQPQVTLNPVTPTSAPLGTSFALVANASVSGGTIVKVEFFDGGSLIGTDTSTPYSMSYAPGSLGQHVFSAKATDLNGNSTISATQTVTITAVPTQPNQKPTVSLTLSPASLTLGQSTTLNSVASDTDGSVTQVEFLDGTTSLQVLTAPPYSYVYTATGSAGNRSIHAVATDNQGATATATQTLAVGSPTLPTPPAPTLAYNQSARTTTATPPDGYAVSDLRYTLNGGAVTPVPSNGQIPMGDGATPAGGLQVYVRANTSRNEGVHAFNGVAFDAVVTIPTFELALAPGNGAGSNVDSLTYVTRSASTLELRYNPNVAQVAATPTPPMRFFLSSATNEVASLNFAGEDLGHPCGVRDTAGSTQAPRVDYAHMQVINSDGTLGPVTDLKFISGKVLISA